MVPSSIARRATAVASLALVAACQDAPDPTGPRPSADRAPQAQDRIELLFQRVSPEVMSLPGTVFADNDERIGKLVIGVENMNAVRGVETALRARGLSENDYAIELTAPIHFAATL